MLNKIFLAIFSICFLVFIVTGVLIFSKFEEEHPTRNDIKYMVVLGAKVRENGISPTLQRRLDKALNVLLLDTTITVIVSGGKGEDEPVSEAEAMSDYLLTHGVNANRIIQEDQSFSTEENIINSRRKIALTN
ncbi:MAG: YdcF family protein, partial [Bacteroidota bacterium]